MDNNVDLNDIECVILTPEVPELDMKDMLINDWGMGATPGSFANPTGFEGANIRYLSKMADTCVWC